MDQLQVSTTFGSVLDVVPWGWGSASPKPSSSLTTPQKAAAVFSYRPREAAPPHSRLGTRAPRASPGCLGSPDSPQLWLALCPLSSTVRSCQNCPPRILRPQDTGGRGLPLPSPQASSTPCLLSVLQPILPQPAVRCLPPTPEGISILQKRFFQRPAALVVVGGERASLSPGAVSHQLLPPHASAGGLGSRGVEGASCSSSQPALGMGMQGRRAEPIVGLSL